MAAAAFGDVVNEPDVVSFYHRGFFPLGAGPARRPISDARFSGRRLDKHTAAIYLWVLKAALVAVAWER